MREWGSAFRGQKFSPVFYWTSSSSGLLPCFPIQSNSFITASARLNIVTTRSIRLRSYLLNRYSNRFELLCTVEVFTSICHSGCIVLYLPLHKSRKICNTIILHYHPNKKLSPLTSASMHIAYFLRDFFEFTDISLT